VQQPDVVPEVEPEPLKTEGSEIVVAAKAIKITDKNTFELVAGPELQRVTGFIRRVKEKFADPKAKAHAAHKAITALEAEVLEPAIEAERILKRAMSDFLVEEQRQRQIEETRLREEERARALKAQEAQAEALDKAGDTEAAVQVLEAPVAPAPIELEKPKAAGISYRSVYKFRVVDQKAMAQAFLTPDLAKIQSLVNSLKFDAIGVVGHGSIEIYEEKVIASRR